jgi:hypothetical protein
VHEEEEVVVDVVEVVVVHVIAVLAGAALWWQERRLNTPKNNAKIGRRITAPLPLTLYMPVYCG